MGIRQGSLLSALAVFLVACGGGGSEGGGTVVTVASVEVTPAVRQAVAGEEFGATARVLASDGRVLTDRSVQWATQDPGVATVSSTGTVRAVAPGTTLVTATVEGRSGQLRLEVGLAPVASVELDAETAELQEGATRQLVATLRDEAGRVLTGRAVTWASTDAGIVSVDPLGALTALRVGRATVTATAGTKSDSAVVIVSTDNDYDLVYDGWELVPGVSPEVFIVDIRQPGGMPARLAPGFGARDPAPSPDGTRIAYSHTVDGRPQIFISNLDGSGRTRLTFSAAHDDQPVWSPDGAHIAFRRWPVDEPGAGTDIWVVDVDGSNPRNLTGDQGATNQADPAWMPVPGGGLPRLAYSSQTNQPEGTAHLWTMAADGSDKRQLTFGNVYDSEPAWSPDATRLVFNRTDETAYLGLHVMEAGGTGARPLMAARLAFGQFAPAWSPDGRLIAFTSKHEDGRTYQVYTVWADGSKLARRTFDDSDKAHPEWIRRVP